MHANWFTGVGSFFVVVLCNLTLDRVYIRLRTSNNGVGLPEFRLPFVIAGALTLPISIALYGWIPQARLPLPFFLLDVAVFGSTLMLGFLPLMTYVVDAFGLYSASAVTALIVTRCLMGTFLPLVTPPLVDQFGYGWGFTILAGMLLSLAPIPAAVFRYGSKWRQRSKYSRDE
jgi:hypothetical protein